MRIEVSGLRVSWPGGYALEGVDLEVRSGELVGVVGPSGAGKSTLLSVLGAAREPTAGQVRIDGETVFGRSPAALRALRSRIGRVHQDLALVPGYRVAQNVLCGRLGRHGLFGGLRRVWLPSRSELAEVHDLLDQVGVADKLFQNSGQLSGGEQQRVAVARALYQEPDLLLADEPVSSVDPARAREVIELLRGVCVERGIGLVVSLHDLALARASLPRLVGLRAGRVAFDGPTEGLDDADFDALYAIEPAA